MTTTIDLHQDIAGSRSHEFLSKQTDFEQILKAGVRIVFGTGFVVPGENFSEVIERDFLLYENQCAANPLWRMVRTQADVEAVLQKEWGIVFHIEGFHGFDGDFSLLDRWYARGWRSTGLVWNEDNLYGGGTHSQKGLTDLGRECIEWCEARNICIDFSHMNQVMFSDCMQTTKNAPFVSHGGLDAPISNGRNFTDEQVRLIAQKGGVFGVFFPKSAMAKSSVFTSDDIVGHILRVTDIAGEDCPALGTDFGGMTSGTPLDIPSVSHIQRLWHVLAKKGCTSAQIEKIASQNAARYLRENLPR